MHLGIEYWYAKIIKYLLLGVSIAIVQNILFNSRSLWGVLDITLCNNVCQWLAAGVVFFGYSGFLLQIEMTATIYIKYIHLWFICE